MQHIFPKIFEAVRCGNRLLLTSSMISFIWDSFFLLSPQLAQPMKVGDATSKGTPLSRSKFSMACKAEFLDAKSEEGILPAWFDNRNW